MTKVQKMLLWAAAIVVVLIVVPAVLIKYTQTASAASRLKEGDTAPDFALPDQNGRTVKLSDFRGKKTVVLAFYIKASTSR